MFEGKEMQPIAFARRIEAAIAAMPGSFSRDECPR
jgi:hypothetical protein